MSLTSLLTRLPLISHTLQEYRDRFATLAPAPRESLTGRFQGEMVGPAWLRYGGPLLLSLLGMRGWWGKEFGADGRGVNLVRRREGLKPSVPVVLREGASRVDGRQGMQVEYPPEAPPQWRPFVDELRWEDRDTLLAMSHLELPLLKRWTLPFLLHRVSPA
jgi:hypothetical protein